MFKIAARNFRFAQNASIQGGLRFATIALIFFPFVAALILVLYYDLWLIISGTWMQFA